MSVRRPDGFRKFVCGLFVSLSGMAWIATAGLAADDIPAEAAIAGVDPQTAIELGDTIVVSVTGLKGAGKGAFSYQSLILLLDGHPLPDHKPTSFNDANCREKERKVLDAQETADTDEEKTSLAVAMKDLAECEATVELRYRLIRGGEDERSKKAWIALLGAPTSSQKIFQVGISMGSGGTLPAGPGAKTEITFEIFSVLRLIIAIMIYLSALVVFLGCARQSRIIRDVAAPELPDGKQPPFSLGRTQMAWWFFLVLGAYLFIAVITGDYETISAQSLILIGIATGTGMGAVAIDFDKIGKAQESLDTAKAELAGLNSKLTALNKEHDRLANVPTASAEQVARLVVLATETAEIPVKCAALQEKRDAAQRLLAGRATDSFLKDLVKDKRGVSFHRFQIVVWSIVLGFVFVTEVYQSLAMPEFSATLLSLMGITGGTYLGFKFPEQKA